MQPIMQAFDTRTNILFRNNGSARFFELRRQPKKEQRKIYDFAIFRIHDSNMISSKLPGIVNPSEVYTDDVLKIIKNTIKQKSGAFGKFIDDVTFIARDTVLYRYQHIGTLLWM